MSKLDDRSEKFLFVGYDTNSKRYKLYNPKIGKTIISCDVEFDEENTWNWDVCNQDYNFFPLFEEEDAQSMVEQTSEEQQGLATPSTSSATSSHSSSSSSSSLNERVVQRTRSFLDLYELT